VIRAGSAGDDLAMAQPDEPAGVIVGFLEVARREQHGAALGEDFVKMGVSYPNG